MRWALLLALGALAGCRAARAGETEPMPAPSASTPAPVASVAPPAVAPPAVAPPAIAPPVIAPSGCPAEMTRVGRTCVDRWEAHLLVRDAQGERVHPPSQRPEKGAQYLARAAPDVFPQAYVSRLEAAAACQAAGKRLCTLGEWYRACRGKKGTTFPYGEREDLRRCNVGKPHLLGKLFGHDPKRWDYARHFNDPRLSLEPGWLAKTGEHADCASDYGAADMVGNLHEWVSDVVDRSLEHKLPLRDDIRDKLDVNAGHGIFMGGFYSTTSEHGRGCGFVTIGHEPKYHDYSTGFRCCRDG